MRDTDTPARRTSRKVVARFGLKGRRLAVVLQEARGRFLVERFEGARRRRKRFDDRDRALLWAEHWYRAGERAAPAPLTLRALFDAYLTTMQDLRKWRGATVLNYAAHRKRIEEVLKPQTLANDLTLGALDTLWRELERAGIAPNQIRQKVKLLQRALAWAYARDLVSHNKLAQWEEMPRVTPTRVPEYQPGDVERLLGAFDPRHGKAWRAWAVLLLAASHGFRINAILHLRWEDVDLTQGVIRLVEAHDKTKRTWERPMTWEAYSALLTARWQASRLASDTHRAIARRRTSPWVIPGNGDRPYTYQAFHAALRQAERDLGIPHVRLRAAHGLRRHAVNEARRRTGDAALALLWVGDTDLRQAPSYVRTREGELQALADARPAGYE